LDLLRDTASEFIVEPLEDGKGIEFIKILAGGEREFHSVKIQTTNALWSLSELTRVKEPKKNTKTARAKRSKQQRTTTGRSILGDLIEKLQTEKTAQVRFVSETSAQPLNLICQDAHQAIDGVSFRTRLSAGRKADYEKFIRPLCNNNDDQALERLKRLRVINWTAPELQQTIERDISFLLYRVDGQPVDPAEVRRLCAEFILESLSKRITREKLLQRLKKEGFYEAHWARNTSILQKIDDLNNKYSRSVVGQLINQEMIQRQEARDAFDSIVKTDNRFGAFVGVAGLGKSCTAAELLNYLKNANILHIALRLDDGFNSTTPKQLGDILDLPMSPVDLLAAVAEGTPCVFLLDQLDAVSIISGRYPRLWSLVEDLLQQAKKYPNMRVWLACRAFDLENDHRLRELFIKEKANQINLRLLTPEEVLRELAKAKVDPRGLGSPQIELLRTPMHLSLYLESDPANKPPFRTVQDLYGRYWDRKQDLVRETLGRSSHWTEVIDMLCDKLSADQGLTVPEEFFDGSYRDDARVMASHNVLVSANQQYRFFHEGFFDYAFARAFVRRGKKLKDLLLNGGEQHLFRRAQVRQILAYLRDREDRSQYLAELESVLRTPGIRSHIIKLVLDWLASVPNPTIEELSFLSLP
jgi:signal recognition particle GTPase